jgi:3-keto-disaccharide hydrolase
VRLVFIAASLLCCLSATSDDQQFNGRWDITVNSDHPRAWWLEVSGADTANLKGRFVGAPGGLVDEIPKLSISGGELRFAFERRYNREQKNPQKGMYYARLEEGKLKGTFEIEGEPSTYLEWSGVRAPAIADKDDGTWKKGEPVSLFDGRDLSGWNPQNAGRPLGWSVKDGMMINAPGSNNLVSDKKFWNFILHVEFRIGVRTNSGIGLRGRYELQIADDFDRPPSIRGTGSIFDRIAPTMNAGDLPGEWQGLDARLVGRQVTVVLNGVKVVDKQTIDGLTAIAASANEGDPGPIVVQGDRGPIEIRRILVYPLIK